MTAQTKTIRVTTSLEEWTDEEIAEELRSREFYVADSEPEEPDECDLEPSSKESN